MVGTKTAKRGRRARKEMEVKLKIGVSVSAHSTLCTCSTTGDSLHCVDDSNSKSVRL